MTCNHARTRNTFEYAASVLNREIRNKRSEACKDRSTGEVRKRAVMQKGAVKVDGHLPSCLLDIQVAMTAFGIIAGNLVLPALDDTFIK